MFEIPADTHEILRGMARDSGVVERGGMPIRRWDARGLQFQGEVIGRTAWIGQPEWARGFGYTKAQIVAIVEKAIAGKRLGKRQALLLESMLVEIPARAAVDELCDTWHTMAPDEQENALDAIFGADTRPEITAEATQGSAGTGAGDAGEKGGPALTGPARPAQPGKAARHFPRPDRNGARAEATIYAMRKSDKRPVGRPALPGRRVVIKLPDELIKRAAKLGDNNVAAGIRKALEQAA